jgi:hypothetical protein
MQAVPMAQLQAAPIAAPQPAPALSAFQQAQQNAAQRKQEQENIKTESSERIKARVKMETTDNERREAAKKALLLVADPGIPNLIKESTAGLVQRGQGMVYTALTGGSTAKDVQSGKLEMIANKITLDLLGGKLGGGVSNDDRDFILTVVGNIGNKNLGTDQRLAAFEQLKEMLSSMAENKPMKLAPMETKPEAETPKPSARRRATLDGVSGGGQARGNAVTNGVDTNNPLLR